MTDTTEPENDAPEDRPTTVALSFTTTSTDPELSTIEAILQLLQLQPYEARVRVLQYVRARVTGES